MILFSFRFLMGGKHICIQYSGPGANEFHVSLDSKIESLLSGLNDLKK